MASIATIAKAGNRMAKRNQPPRTMPAKKCKKIKAAMDRQSARCPMASRPNMPAKRQITIRSITAPDASQPLCNTLAIEMPQFNLNRKPVCDDAFLSVNAIANRCSRLGEVLVISGGFVAFQR
jgi:hypothetical protein